MYAHHETPYSRHVVDVRKADQTNRRQVMDEHYHEVLKSKGERDGYICVHQMLTCFKCLFNTITTFLFHLNHCLP